LPNHPNQNPAARFLGGIDVRTGLKKAYTVDTLSKRPPSIQGLPRDVRDVIVLADGRSSGAGLRPALESRRAPRSDCCPSQGMDSNDILLGRTRRIDECAQ
jgi:hypothetical protein